MRMKYSVPPVIGTLMVERKAHASSLQPTEVSAVHVPVRTSMTVSVMEPVVLQVEIVTSHVVLGV
jgi:hypothetical protein